MYQGCETRLSYIQGQMVCMTVCHLNEAKIWITSVCRLITKENWWPIVLKNIKFNAENQGHRLKNFVVDVGHPLGQ